MLEILGKHYYIDIDQIIEKCRPDYSEVNETGDDDKNEGNELELNVFKYECFKTCMERVLNDYEESDGDTDLFPEKNLNQSFKLAFNTLLINDIIIDNDE